MLERLAEQLVRAVGGGTAINFAGLPAPMADGLASALAPLREALGQ